MSVIKHVTANSTVTQVGMGRNFSQVEILNRGDVEVWVRVDPAGTPASVGGDDVEVVPAMSSLVVPSRSRANTVVSFVTDGDSAALSLKGIG